MSSTACRRHAVVLSFFHHQGFLQDAIARRVCGSTHSNNLDVLTDNLLVAAAVCSPPFGSPPLLRGLGASALTPHAPLLLSALAQPGCSFPPCRRIFDDPIIGGLHGCQRKPFAVRRLLTQAIESSHSATRRRPVPQVSIVLRQALSRNGLRLQLATPDALDNMFYCQPSPSMVGRSTSALSAAAAAARRRHRRGVLLQRPSAARPPINIRRRAAFCPLARWRRPATTRYFSPSTARAPPCRLLSSCTLVKAPPPPSSPPPPPPPPRVTVSVTAMRDEIRRVEVLLAARAAPPPRPLRARRRCRRRRRRRPSLLVTRHLHTHRHLGDFGRCAQQIRRRVKAVRLCHDAVAKE